MANSEGMKRRNRVPDANPLSDSFNSFDPQELSSCVSSAIRAVLLANLNKTIIVTRQIQDEIKRRYPNHEKNAAVLAEYAAFKAADVFKRVFGFELFVGDPIEPPKSDGVSRKPQKIRVSDVWMLTNMIDINHIVTSKEKEQFGILMVTLSILIFSRERDISINQLVDELSGMFQSESSTVYNISKDDCKDLISEFEKSGYLKKIKVKGDDDTLEDGVTFGLRSYIEIGEDRILQFMSEVSGVSLSTQQKKDHYFLDEADIDNSLKRSATSSSSNDDDDDNNHGNTSASITRNNTSQSQSGSEDSRLRKRQRA